MKKVFASLLAMVMLFSATAFGGESETSAMITKANVIYSGIKENVLGGIYIKESGSGVFQKGKKLYLDFDGLPMDLQYANVTVAEGDLKIKRVREDNGIISIEIERESSTVSVIKISGVVVPVSRDISLGSYALRILTENSDTYPDNIFNDKQGKPLHLMENFITVKEDDRDHSQEITTITATANSNQMTVQKGKTLDAVNITAKPFLSSENRLMVPLRPVIEAVGEGITFAYEEKTKTVSVHNGVYISQFRLGEDTLMVNGTSHTMGECAVVKNGVTYLPIRALVWILGIQNPSDFHFTGLYGGVTYNGGTQTATLSWQKYDFSIPMCF